MTLHVIDRWQTASMQGFCERHSFWIMKMKKNKFHFQGSYQILEGNLFTKKTWNLQNVDPIPGSKVTENRFVKLQKRVAFFLNDSTWGQDKNVRLYFENAWGLGVVFWWLTPGIWTFHWSTPLQNWFQVVGGMMESPTLMNVKAGPFWTCWNQEGCIVHAFFFA